MSEKRNSIANTPEFRLSCTKPSISSYQFSVTLGSCHLIMLIQYKFFIHIDQTETKKPSIIPIVIIICSLYLYDICITVVGCSWLVIIAIAVQDYFEAHQMHVTCIHVKAYHLLSRPYYCSRLCGWWLGCSFSCHHKYTKSVTFLPDFQIIIFVVGGYIGFTLSVCPSVCPSVRPSVPPAVSAL